jgi:hypothetical protein
MDAKTMEELHQSMDFMQALVDEASSAPHRRRGSLNESASFRVFKDLECRDEYQKVKLAGFLRELSRMATEDTKEKVRSSIIVSMNGGGLETGGDKNKIDLNDVNLDVFTPQQAAEKINLFKQGGKIQAGSLMILVQAATAVLGKEDTVLDLRALQPTPQKVTVVGDLHGSLSCLMNVLRLVNVGMKQEDVENGSDDKSGGVTEPVTAVSLEPDRVIVFDGDYVDRGKNSLEVIAILLMLKLSHRNQVFLLRGNHEDIMTASTYGFRDEIDSKYGQAVGDVLW